MYKWNAETYFELFEEWPNQQMILSGWEFHVKYYLFGLIPVVIYTKPLTK